MSNTVDACRHCGGTDFKVEDCFLCSTVECTCCGAGDSDMASIVLDKHGNEIPPLVQSMTKAKQRELRRAWYAEPRMRLVDRATGVAGTYCIQRNHPEMYVEHWSEKAGWTAFGTVYTLAEANKKLEELKKHEHRA